MVQLLHFGWSSGAGLVADLGLFALLVLNGASGARANVASSTVAITIAYFLVSRYSFRAVPTWRTYAVFVAWYATLAALVSLLIDVAAGGDEGLALVAKLCSVPVTFTANYLFGRWLFAGGAERLLARLGVRPPTAVRRAAAVVRRHRDVVAAGLVAIWHRVLIMPLNERLAFAAPQSADDALRRDIATAVFAVAIWGVAFFAIRFARQVRAGGRRHLTWALISAAVLAVNAAVFLLIYPGLWIWDEFGVLSTVRTSGWFAWQGYLTNIYYSISLLLIPSGVGVVIIQLMFGAVVAGYAVSTLATYLARPALALLCAIPLLSFATLLSNQYPLRLTVYAYLLVLLLVRLVVAWRSERPVSPAAVAGFGVVVAMLAFWRTEGAVFLLLLPVYLLVGSYRSLWRASRSAASLAVVVAVSAIGLSGAATMSASDPRYQVPAYVNPLSTMLQHDMTSPNLRSDFAAIDRVIPVAALRANPSYVEAPAYWTAGVRPGFETGMSGIRSAYIDLVIHNPGPFLANRVHAFLATNSMQPDHLPQIEHAGAFGDSQASTDAFQTFITTDPAARPLDAALRLDGIQVLLLTGTPRSSLAASVVWNSAPALAGTLAVLVWALVRRRRHSALWAVCAGAVLANASLVALTAPAAFFMYYFPSYLAGGLLVASLVAAKADALLSRRAALRADLAGAPVGLQEPGRV